MLIFIGFSLLLASHWDYYGLPRLKRPFHPSHSWLRSSGRVGLTAGTGAAVLFVLNLGYLVRKRLIKLTVLGPLRGWMNAHVLTGLFGGGLVAFHSAMAPSSSLGILALAALVITVITGIVGRTIYIRVPRSLEGRELEFQQVQSQLETCRQRLKIAGVHSAWLHQTKPPVRTHRTGLIGCFMALVAGDRQRRQDYRSLKRQILNSPALKPAARTILPQVKAFCLQWQWFTRYHELRSLIASWRFFHRWLAVLMLCVVFCHVVVAIRYGDLHLWGSAQ